MRKKISDGSRRSWNLLRLALLWARKGGVFKRKLLMELRLLPRYLKTICHSGQQRGAIHFGERQLSFKDTPIFNLKMRRPASLRFRIPCINNHPQVDFDYDFDNDSDDTMTSYYYNDGARKSSLNNNDRGNYEDDNDQMVLCEEEEGIDVKAEEFIAKFYQQMKLQRQISYRQYNDMLNRGAT